jgi:hypothetical protein
MPGGRPTDYTPEIAANICQQIAEGKSLVTILKAKEMPVYSTVMRWRIHIPEFSEKYARARSDQGDSIYEEIMEIERMCLDKQIDPNTARVLIDSKKWRAGKMKPKTYGDRQLTGQDEGPEHESLLDKVRERRKATHLRIVNGGESVSD